MCVSVCLVGPTNGVEESLHGVLWAHGPTGESDCSCSEVVPIVKERLVHPGQGHFLLLTHTHTRTHAHTQREREQSSGKTL